MQKVLIVKSQIGNDDLITELNNAVIGNVGKNKTCAIKK